MKWVGSRVVRAFPWVLVSSLLGVGGCTSDPAGGNEPGGGCLPGQLECGDTCVDPRVDPGNCGACGHACSTGMTCQDSQCQCQAGLTACGAGCTNTNEDGNNCGACGVVCVAPEVCSMGTCAGACAGGLTACGTSCVDTSSSLQHCGGCGIACAAAQVCSAGTCQCAVAGQVHCGDGCVDVQSNTAHCGACGNACAAGQSCTNGTCTGGSAGSGGAGTGGATSGGATSGGATSGGATTGGATTGGATSGGATSGGGTTTGGGGATSGGAEPAGGGTTSGGAGAEPGGGTDTGGATTGGATTGGATTGGTTNPDCDTTLPVLDNPAPAADYVEQVGGVSFDMVYIPGGTFTLGCETSSCDPDTSPVPGVSVSSYHMMKNEVSAALREAVTGEAVSGFGSGNWYDCIRLACELSRQTGRPYRMQTEAEFEYAAKNYLGKLAQIDGSEEWAYNSWSTSHSTDLTDPVGPASGKHTQKTRRDKATGDNITGRLIRSIDGIGPSCRLVVSNEMDYPPDYVPPCQICPPHGEEPENSYRDPRWITGSDMHWVAGAELGFGTMDLRVWEDGTAKQGNTDGQWFTSNNIAFVFVPNSGTRTTYQYIFLDDTQGSLLSDAGFGFGGGGFIGRIAKEPGDSVAKPTIPNLQSGADLAAAAGPNFKMIDMANIPESAKGQDPRLLDGVGQGWFQNNINAGGTHNYRKDVDPDEFRFVVIDGGRAVMLANGNWFTVNDMFLRITHPDGYTCDYLYAVSSDGGTFYHNSYQGYERADFRMFQIYSNTSGDYPPTCIGNSCSEEIPKGQAASFYSTQEVGQSTFVPARCPASGCY